MEAVYYWIYICLQCSSLLESTVNCLLDGELISGSCLLVKLMKNSKVDVTTMLVSYTQVEH